MSQPYQDLDAAIEERRRMRARRRRLLHLRRTLIILVAAALLALVIATPFWIINGVRHRADQSDGEVTPTTTATTATPTTAPTKPVAAVTDEQTVQLTDEVDAAYAVLLDMTDGRVVAEKNADQTHAPASITKVLTLLTAVENIDDLDTEYTMSWKVIDPAYKAGANTTGLESGETVRLEDLLRTAPRAGSSSGGDGDTTLLLLGHPVHGSSAVVGLADLVVHTGVIQDTFGRCGLASIDMSHDANIAIFFEGILSGHALAPL